MTSDVRQLVFLYAGLVLVNTVVAALLWSRQRLPLYRSLLQVWLATTISALTQGALYNQSGFLNVVGFSGIILINFALTNLVSSVTETPYYWKSYLIILGLSYSVSFTLSRIGTGFTIMALPVAVAVSLPLLSVTFRVIRRRWQSLSLTSRGLCTMCLVFAAHNLDYAFLRPLPQYEATGFTIAALIVFGLSIFALGVSLELVTEQQTRTSAEIAVAHRIQTEILPKNPSVPGFEISCYMKPAEEVGGDYYDFLTVEGHTWILLGDVTGHGLRSGLIMLMAQSILSAVLHARPKVTPRELNYLANRILFHNLERLNDTRLMTIVSLCRVDDANHFVVSGSHDSLYIYRARTKRVETIEMDHFPCGLGFDKQLPLPEITEGAFHLEEDDILFLATDGVVEAPREGDYRRGLFSEARLVDLLRANAGLPVDEIKRVVIESLEQFTGGTFFDDVTFLILRARRTQP